MKQELHAYVPEMDYTNEKALFPLRTHREDISVIDPADQYRILAHRPTIDDKDATLPSLWKIPADELLFLQSALHDHSRVALFADGCAVLVLGELCTSSGVLLAIRPEISPASLRRYAEVCEFGDLVFSPAFPKASASLSGEETEQMDELNFYITQILTPQARLGLSTLAWRVANFVGCRIEGNDLPSDDLRLADGQIKRLTAYLLCVFLHLHTLSGSVSANGAAAPDAPQYRCRIEYVDPHADGSNQALLQLAGLRFHRLSAFSDFVLRRKGDCLILDAQLQLSPDKKALCAAIPSLYLLRMTLEKI